jgi:hypothetical protein
MHLKPAWTASMSTLSGLVAVCLCSPRLTSWTYDRLVKGAGVVLVLTAGFYAFDSLSGTRSAERYRPQQASWPADAIAGHALEAWARATPAPLRIVMGETRVAGLVALKAPGRPSLVTDAEPWRAPWVTAERLRREGALLVWAEPSGVDPLRMRALAGEAPIQQVDIPWPRAASKPPLRLHVAVLLPHVEPAPPAKP